MVWHLVPNLIKMDAALLSVEARTRKGGNILGFFKSLSPPKVNVTIELTKAEYALGETMDGAILVVSQEAFEVQEIRIDIVSRERIKGKLLDFSGDQHTRIYGQLGSQAGTARPTQLDLLVHSNPVPVSGPIKVPDKYDGKFMFRVTIPPHLGPSYQGGRQDGSWLQRIWMTKATIAVAGRPDVEVAKEFQVSASKSEGLGAGGVAAADAVVAGSAAASQGTAQAPKEEVIPTNCPKCGAPFTVTQEDIFITCRYCGYSLTIASRQRLGKHSMLETRFFRQQAAEAAQKYMDKGIFRVGVAKESVITNVMLRYLPFWIFRSNSTTSFRGTIGGSGMGLPTGGGRDAQTAEAIGKLILVGADAYMRSKGGRGMGVGYNQNAPRPVAQTFSNQYTWPVLARAAMISEVNFYGIPTEKKIPFDQGKIPSDAEFLRSEMTEAEAKEKAKVEIEAKERKIASGKVSTLETISTNIYFGEGELIHAPVWFVYYTLKGENYIIAIDACDGKVLGGGRPLFKLNI
jgi:DNA-directed RNA polymerase subunit RPC12/RpoP